MFQYTITSVSEIFLPLKLHKHSICPAGEIPDAAFIHAARKRRQLARELGGDAPLVQMDTPQKRLDQEDQDASDDDEDEKRIRFSGVKNKTQRQKIAEEIGIVLAPWLLSYTDFSRPF